MDPYISTTDLAAANPLASAAGSSTPFRAQQQTLSVASSAAGCCSRATSSTSSVSSNTVDQLLQLPSGTSGSASGSGVLVLLYRGSCSRVPTILADCCGTTKRATSRLQSEGTCDAQMMACDSDSQDTVAAVAAPAAAPGAPAAAAAPVAPQIAVRSSRDSFRTNGSDAPLVTCIEAPVKRTSPTNTSADDCSAACSMVTVHGVHMPADGWYRKCRGCGAMTAYEKAIDGVEMPICRRCQVTLQVAEVGARLHMHETLVYVHSAWSNAGL